MPPLSLRLRGASSYHHDARRKETVKESVGQNKNEKGKKTYNIGDSLVVTDPTTNPALRGLSRGERTGSRVFHVVWSYVVVVPLVAPYEAASATSS